MFSSLLVLPVRIRSPPSLLIWMSEVNQEEEENCPEVNARGMIDGVYEKTCLVVLHQCSFDTSTDSGLYQCGLAVSQQKG